MNRFVVGTSVISLLVLGGCGGGGGGSSSDVSVAGNASGIQTPQEGETAPTQTADQSLPMPADLPPVADASDGSPNHATPTVRSIVPVTNSVNAPDDDAGGALSETPTPPPPKPPKPVTVQVEEEDDSATTTTGGTTNPKPPKAPKPPKSPKPAGSGSTGNSGGSTTGSTYGEAYTSNDGGSTTGPTTIQENGTGAVPTPEPLTTSLFVLAAGSLVGYATRRRR